MSELKARLRTDLTAAMKAQDKLRTATLRMLLASIQSEEVSGKQARELSDEDVLKVLAREAKKRGEAAEIYTQNGRGELAANEHAEARVIDEYLPTPLTDAELADVVDTALAQVAEELGERPGVKADGSGDEGGQHHRRRQGRRGPVIRGGEGSPVAPPGRGARRAARRSRGPCW
ncbi:MAG: GatB/YqeY domain-containing protein [Mycobacterium sp.]|nr:GatB/YqeY domain-containing protein [Mycobacterium sp.]